MKQILTALVVMATGYSLNTAGWFGHAASTPPTTTVTRTTSDPFASEAAFRHRTCQPNHWRAMLLQK